MTICRSLNSNSETGIALLDRRFRQLDPDLVDVRRDRHWLDIVQPEASLLRPVEELLYCPRVGEAGVAIADVGREELDESPSCSRAVRKNGRGQDAHSCTARLTIF